MAGAQRKAEDQSKLAVTQAWVATNLSRQKKLQSLESLLAKLPKKQKPQSRVELQAMCDALAAAWGARKD